MATGAAAAAWDRANTVRVHLKLNKHTDAEIIEKLSKVDSKQGYIKQLIRADISREREGRLSGCEDNFALGR